ncbi:bacillithiol biosynthesis cysteine-adding enzyme BshC [Microbacteriaceae bacterium 4G12]
MEMKEISVALLKGAAADYLEQKQDIVSCFDYPLEADVFQKRVKDLEGRTYLRRELVDHLLQYNKRLHAGAKTIENIYALAQDDTYVVIGGQQAGLLTGPLYSIHKVISILQLAKEQEEHIGSRVVPVFWIAGEDHDIDEINHVFVMNNGRMKKSIIPQTETKKTIASNTPLDYDLCWNWVQEVFKTYPETKYTKDLLQLVQDCLRKSNTYVDFFAHMIMELFKEEGLILIDSGSDELRELEKAFFATVLEHHEGIQAGLNKQQQLLQERGYTPIITTKQNAIHLFFHADGERWLLEKEGERFVCQDGKYAFSYDELREMMEKTPQLFSNNVVTRPLMQEYLFPTLAFIGGPGEIAYWAELQQVFHEVGFVMPPVVPRLMISYIERAIDTDMHDVALTPEDVLLKRIGKLREEWLANQVVVPIAERFTTARKQIEEVHASLRDLAGQVNVGLEGFAEKNQMKIDQQLDILERAIQKDIETKHAVHLNKFRRIEVSLQPAGSLQERVWNICYYLNEYGFDFIPELMKLSFTWDGTYKVIKL